MSQSAGAMPGPACYDKGGQLPTVTDADVVLGYIDPNYFLGGRQRLNKERAVRAIRRRIAEPLGLTVEEAAFRIRKLIDGVMGQEIYKQAALKGYDPREFALFAFGGAGPVHCCGYGEYADARKIVTFPFGAVFNAFGASTMDVMHTYIRTRPLRLFDAHQGGYLSDLEAFNSVVRGLQERGLVDMRGEGFKAEEILFSLDLAITGKGEAKVWMRSPRVLPRGPEDVKAICEAYRANTGSSQEGDILVQSFLLRSVARTPHWEAPFHPSQGPDSRAALKGEREVYWEAAGGLTRTRVYHRHLLNPGNVVEGPALVDAVDTTCVIPPGWRLTVDGYLNGVIERAEGLS